MEQNEDLVALLNQNEEGKASLMKYRNSVIYLDSLAKFQGSKSTVSQNAMNVESLNKHMQAQKIASAQKINSKQVDHKFKFWNYLKFLLLIEIKLIFLNFSLYFLKNLFLFQLITLI